MTRLITASQFATLFLIATILAGTMGVLVLCFLMWLSYSRLALDLLGKHGISESEVSRLGGIGIFLGISSYLLVDYLLGGSIIFLRVSEEVEFSLESWFLHCAWVFWVLWTIFGVYRHV